MSCLGPGQIGSLLGGARVGATHRMQHLKVRFHSVATSLSVFVFTCLTTLIPVELVVSTALYLCHVGQRR